LRVPNLMLICIDNQGTTLVYYFRSEMRLAPANRLQSKSHVFGPLRVRR